MPEMSALPIDMVSMARSSQEPNSLSYKDLMKIVCLDSVLGSSLRTLVLVIPSMFSMTWCLIT